MYRKLLFNNLSIVWNIKILLIIFDRRVRRCCVQSLVQISKIAGRSLKKEVCNISRICEKKKVGGNGRGERVDIQFLNV